MPAIDLTSPGTVWVLATVLKATVVLLAVVGLAVALRRSSAALRHFVWSVGIVGVLALPFLSVAVPWRFPVVRIALPSAPGAAAVPTVHSPAPETGDVSVPIEVGQPVLSTVPPAGIITAPASPPGRRISAASALLVAWLVVALLLVARLAVGAAVLVRAVRRAKPLDTPEWTHPLMEAADRLGLPRLPRLVVSDRLPVPFACGLFLPAIVLPTVAHGWDDVRRRAVLCHELAHVRRFDLLLNTLGHLACALWWFHPLVWVASRRLQTEGERASDDLVLGAGTRPSEYADHLLHIVCTAAHVRAPAVALPMAQRHAFEGRLLALLERGARRTPPSRRLAGAMAALAIVLMVPLAAAGGATVAERLPDDSAGVGAAGNTETSGAAAAARGESEFQQARPAEQGRTDAHTAPSGAPSIDGRAAKDERADDAGTERTAAPDSATGATPQEAAQEATTVTALIRALDDSVAMVRQNAAYALGRLQADAAAEPLGARLADDPEPEVREMAAWALGQIESRAATGPLSSGLNGDSSPRVRQMAAWALGQIEDPASVDALASAVEADRSSDVRETAAWALGQTEPRTAPAPLIGALRDPVPGVRETAAWALGQIADAAATDALVAALDDADASVRHTAFWALAQMPGGAAQPALLRALQDADPAIRAAAARALAGSSLGPQPRPRPRPIPN